MEKQGGQTCRTIKHFIKEDLAKNFGNSKTTFINGKKYTKTKDKDFALEILEKRSISLCGQQVKTTGVPAVFYAEESSKLKTGNLKINMEMLLSSINDTFNFELFKKRERERERFLRKFGTLQSESQRLKIQTMIEISKNIFSPSVTLFEKRTHGEGAGSVLHFHKCAKMVTTISNLPFWRRRRSCVSSALELFFY